MSALVSTLPLSQCQDQTGTAVPSGNEFPERIETLRRCLQPFLEPVLVASAATKVSGVGRHRRPFLLVAGTEWFTFAS